ncbi:MAG TPA: arabinofuranosidase catalytic domain-containing protein [Polyangiaceae bacterium]|nr:arabinofuranosidase catalytic domain-containing protein [Polyangiaceae bacterium]
MRFVHPSFLAVSSILCLGFGCSSSSPSSSDGTSGSTSVSGSAGQTSGASGATGAAGAGNGTAGALGGAGASGTGAGGMSTSGGGNGGASGGRSGAGGVTGGGGAAAAGGSGTAGGAGKGGASAGGSGGAGTAGSAGAGGAQSGTLPGDIAAAAGTPMVAAHAVTRALFAAYNGKLFQARRASDGMTQDINTVSAGGLVDLNALNTFCASTTCTVAKLYDQAGNGNDMTQATAANQPSVGFWTAADSTKYPMVVSKGYQWLRNRANTKKTIPVGSSPQTEYFVVHGDYAGAAAGTNGCCYDYGNMENHIGDDGPGTMSALYFGTATDWTRGAGAGPWVMLDMENGVFAGGGPIAILNAGNASVNMNDPSLKYASPNIVTGLAKTDGTANFEIKYGNASTGALSIAWNGSLPTKSNPTSYIPLHQQGGISLGEGGDGSAMGTGAFSEGAIIAAETSDATDTAIQANLTSLYK